VLESLKYVSSESSIVVFTDADAFWEPDALNKATTYFADPSVGAVTLNITYSGDKVFENTYRDYYNIIRVAESKIYATPVHNGPFLAIRTELLRKFGLPAFPGSDDSSFGSYIALLGFRAIQVDNVAVKELVRGSQFRRKVRRAQHLLLNFLKTKQYAKKLGVYRHTKPFEKVWKIEWWLHVINPWLLIICAILLAMSTFYGSFTALILLGIGLMLLALRAYRTWILQQFYLIIAAVRNLWTKEITWSK
jgi:cellulose synthase/poly-beta-1,6-N-acetylglucosamine synthase-like glycosyltransferase